MKFLALSKRRPGPPPDPKVVIALSRASQEWIKAKLADGTLDCAYNVVPNANGYFGAAIANAHSNEEVYQQLTAYPFFLLTDFEVYPLSDAWRAIDDNVSAV